jgi:AcrR family transcriptional regulator
MEVLVARPKIPLISRRSALAAALKIIDEEGLDALSIRRLGDELNVNGASFYHHFKSKDDILVGVAQLALADVRAPETDEDWRSWLPANARGLRDALLAHPNLIPVLLRREGMGIGTEQLEASAKLLEQQGVPTHLVLTIIDTLEVFAIASALHEVNATTQTAIEASDELHPALMRAYKMRSPVTDKVFDELCLSIITTLEAALGTRRRRPAPRRTAASA